MTNQLRPRLKRMRSSLLFWALALLLVSASAGTTPDHLPGIAVRSTVQISTDEPTSRHVESWLAINPRDPHNLIAASMVFGEPSGVAAYASHDGGKSWVRATHGPRSDRVFEGLDPAVAFDPRAKPTSSLCRTTSRFGAQPTEDGVGAHASSSPAPATVRLSAATVPGGSRSADESTSAANGPSRCSGIVQWTGTPNWT